ncbi:MAG: LamB/YcsF family protein [Sphingobacteriales bacterium]|nr:MAG: LamB/YcsF family protein [Sphingobacteriales bacterium]
MPVIDFNCDLGEGTGNDEAIMPFISSASIACGYHAGDEATMKTTVALCKKYNVAIGAHPSFPDKENFGRTNMQLPADEIYDMVCRQIELLIEIAYQQDKRLQHVKPHGALYNMAAKDMVIANAIAKSVKDCNESLLLFGLPGSKMEMAAKNYGLSFIGEAFADRTYQRDGSLTPRTATNALIEDEAQSIAQVLQLVNHKIITAINGDVININAKTICLHSDGKQAVQFAEALHGTLISKGITIQSFNS